MVIYVAREQRLWLYLKIRVTQEFFNMEAYVLERASAAVMGAPRRPFPITGTETVCIYRFGLRNRMPV